MVLFHHQLYNSSDLIPDVILINDRGPVFGYLAVLNDVLCIECAQ